jgi:hypothetical protein
MCQRMQVPELGTDGVGSASLIAGLRCLRHHLWQIILKRLRTRRKDHTQAFQDAAMLIVLCSYAGRADFVLIASSCVLSRRNLTAARRAA